MTVSELRKILAELPDTMPVGIVSSYSDGGWYSLPARASVYENDDDYKGNPFSVPFLALEGE